MSEALKDLRKMPDLSEVPPEVAEEAIRTAEPMLHPEEKAAAAAFREHAHPLSEMIDGAFDLMSRRAEGKANPIPTPWDEVNEALGGGFWPGFHVLTGGTGAGKSQWALQVAWTAAKQGTPVLYLGLELGKEDLVARLAGLALADSEGSAPPWSKLYLGKDRAALKRAEKALRKFQGAPFFLEFGPPGGWSASELDRRVRALRLEFPEKEKGSSPLLVVLDYLQIIGAEEDPQEPGRRLRQELRERIGRAAYEARHVAREYGAVVLALSSISRDYARMLANERKVAAGEAEISGVEGLGAGDPGRFVGLGKESGEIEFAADSVLALARGRNLGDRSEAYLAIAKLRARPDEYGNGWRVLHFNGGFFFPEDTESRRERLALAQGARKNQKTKARGSHIPEDFGVAV